MKWIYTDLKVAYRVPEIRRKVLLGYACRVAATFLALMFAIIFAPLGLLVLIGRFIEPLASKAIDLTRMPEDWLRSRYRSLRSEVHAQMSPDQIRQRLDGRCHAATKD